MFYYKNQIKVYYEKRGSGNPIIFLHGYLLDSSCFLNTNIENATMYFIDLPGFGKSSRVPLTIPEYSRLIEDFIKDNKIVNPMIVGHSFGGRVAIDFATRNEENKIVLVSTPGISHSHNMITKTKIMLYKFFGFDFSSDDYNQSDSVQKRIMVNALGYCLEDKLTSIFNQTLIIHGKKDTTVKIKDAKKMNKKIKNSALIQLNCGHFPFLERNYEFSKIVGSFNLS